MNDHFDPEDLDRIEITLKKLAGDDLYELLLSLAGVEDWRWAQGIYLKYVDHPDRWAADAAIHGLGDLARLSGRLEKEKVTSCLKDLGERRAEVSGAIFDALSDIEHFIRDDENKSN